MYRYVYKLLDIDCTNIFPENEHSNDFLRCIQFFHIADIDAFHQLGSPSQIVVLYAMSSALEAIFVMTETEF